MGFKLGTNRGNYAVSGEIRTKMRFGAEAGGDASIPGTPVIRKPLEEGVLGEANMDGSIYISDKIIPGSEEERQVINHEMRHSTDMKVGKLEYGETRNGKDMINIYGEWKEAGDTGFPWENDANNGINKK